MFGIILIQISCSIEITEGHRQFAADIIPKLLYFEKISQPIQLQSVDESDDLLNFVGKSDELTIKATSKTTNSGKYDPYWAECSDHDDWIYSKPDETVEKTAMKYMEMLVNSIEPPKLVRITSHRSKKDGNITYHQVTMLITIFEQRTLQYIHYKVNSSGRDSFLTHSVVMREGEI